MSVAKLVVTAVTVQGVSQAEAAATYGVSKGWVSKLMARWRAEGDAACEPRSTRPHYSPTAIGEDVIHLIVAVREQLSTQGLDAGPDTIRWHLDHHHHAQVSRATIARTLSRQGLVTPEPRKRPTSSYTRFEAAQPNQCWQSDFTHYQLTRPDGTPGAPVEILTWLDDCSRMALRVSAHPRVTAAIVLAQFRAAITVFGTPASTLTDNGMVFTTRFSGGKGGRNAFETELRRLNIVQKNGTPNHPQTQGKVERFQQTLKKWLHAQHPQPATLTALQTLLDTFTTYYNQSRPHTSLPHRQTPAMRYASLPKAVPTTSRDTDTHNRVRYDRVDTTGSVTLRYNGRLHHIGIGRTHAGTRVTLLVQDLHITILNTTTGEILRDLILNPTRDYQPITQTKNP